MLQDACVDEERTPDKAQILKGSIPEVKAGASDPGKIERYYLSMQVWS